MGVMLRRVNVSGRQRSMNTHVLLADVVARWADREDRQAAPPARRLPPGTGGLHYRQEDDDIGRLRASPQRH